MLRAGHEVAAAGSFGYGAHAPGLATLNAAFRAAGVLPTN
jgi:hypothetical protein